MIQPRVFVTDFDGTMTERDFYSLVVERLLPLDTPDHWADYRAGTLTHFEALRKYFASIRADESSVLQLIGQMEIDPDLKTSLSRLEESGWKVIVASAGCRWYIDKLLAGAGVNLEVHANPGQFEPSRGLAMELPVDSPFFSNLHGIHKAAIVRHFIKAGAVVAFAGDGFPDIEAAKSVGPNLRFARRDLANALQREGEVFRTYRVWSEIAERLIEISSE